MAALLAQRLLQSIGVLLGVAIITFLLLHYLPADPAALVAGRSANAQMIANVRHQLGLDLPLPLQFWRLSHRTRSRRSRPLVHSAQRGPDADRGAHPGDARPDGLRHRWSRSRSG